MYLSTRRLSLLLALATLALPSIADDTDTHQAEAPDMAAAMEAMQKAAAPGEHHRFLANLEGDWEYTSSVWMAPGQPPMESVGKSTKTTIMGGRYLQEEVQGDFMGNVFHGHGVTAYDNTAGEFINTWYDDMSTSIAVSRGQRDDHTLTMHGEYLDPMSGQNMKVRAVVRVIDSDHHVFQYFMTMPGAPEHKSMELAYSRKASE